MRLTWLHVVLAAMGLGMIAWGNCTAHADDAQWDATLALTLAQVAANEGALWSPRDTALVWQVVEVNGGDSSASRLDFLRAHSPRVTGSKPCPDVGNCAWARQLATTALTMPAAVATGAAVRDWPAYWRHELAPRWQTVLDIAWALVRGEDGLRPCVGRPRTWGSVDPMLPDERVAARNGLYRMRCKGVKNDGYASFRVAGTEGGT
jgi:hypothetical protein